MATLIAFSALLGVSFLVRTLFVLRYTPILAAAEDDPITYPKVSVLLPARNEASRVLKDNVMSLIFQSYPNLEIVVVDDRSTDHTLDILQELATVHGDRLTIVNGKDTPAGWLGKLFALHQAREVASGEWLLSADADVVYSPHAIRAAISYAQTRQLDAISLLPHVLMKSGWEAVIIPAMSWLSLMRVSTTQANRESSRACFGYGNFILFRKEAHDSLGGFSAYKNNVLDDCVIMEMFKSRGFKVMVADGSRLMQSRMYTTLNEIIQGFGKNSFAALRYSVLRTVALIMGEILFVLFPIIYVANHFVRNGLHLGTNALMALIAVLSFSLTMLAFGKRMGADKRFFLLYPVGHSVSVVTIAYSMCAFLLGRGVKWKDRAVGRRREGGRNGPSNQAL